MQFPKIFLREKFHKPTLSIYYLMLFMYLPLEKSIVVKYESLQTVKPVNLIINDAFCQWRCTFFGISQGTHTHVCLWLLDPL